jgi:hypothetical protein
MPYFADIADYGGLRVPFCKRAQLAAADLALAFNGQGPGRFSDLDRLTIFADNLVPHVLRTGILVYRESLAERIDSGDLITAGRPKRSRSGHVPSTPSSASSTCSTAACAEPRPPSLTTSSGTAASNRSTRAARDTGRAQSSIEAAAM